MTLGPLLIALLEAVAGTDPSTDSLAPPPSTVIAVILPSVPNLPMREALNRLRGEADSVGFELRLVEAAPNVEPLAQIDAVARRLAPAAVVALVGRTNEDSPDSSPLGSIDVWFLDRSTGKTSLGHLTVEEEAGNRADLVLAVRVVDFIRARMFDSLVRTLAEARARKHQVATHALVGRRFLAGGVGGTGSFSGLSPALMPLLEAGYSLRTWLRLTLGVGGFATQPQRNTASGSAVMDQWLAKVGVTFMARTWWRLFPFAEAGASVFFLSVRGSGNSGYLGHDVAGWSPGAYASTGLGVVLTPHLELRVAGGAMLLLREPKVFIGDAEVASTGRPAWLVHALLGVSF